MRLDKKLMGLLVFDLLEESGSECVTGLCVVLYLAKHFLLAFTQFFIGFVEKGSFVNKPKPRPSTVEKVVSENNLHPLSVLLAFRPWQLSRTLVLQGEPKNQFYY